MHDLGSCVITQEPRSWFLCVVPVITEEPHDLGSCVITAEPRSWFLCAYTGCVITQEPLHGACVITAEPWFLCDYTGTTIFVEPLRTSAGEGLKGGRGRPIIGATQSYNLVFLRNKTIQDYVHLKRA